METCYLGNGGRTMATKHPSSRRYPAEVKQRAVQLVLITIEQRGERHGVVSRIARQLDVGPETLRHWIRQAEIDAGTRPGTTSAERQRIAELEKENRELRRANQILKEASVFFAQELDRPRRSPPAVPRPSPSPTTGTSWPPRTSGGLIQSTGTTPGGTSIASPPT